MPGVIERNGHSIDAKGFIHYDDRPFSFEDADKIAGRRLDRRRNYAIIDGKVCESVTWSTYCTGCCEREDGYGPNRGIGCPECGYTGRSRQSQWVPINNT